MINYVKYLIFLLFIVDFATPDSLENSTPAPHDYCKTPENQFKVGIQEFYTCAVKRTTQDFWFCKECSRQFWIMSSGYEFLKNTTDNATGVPCINELVNIDRMNYFQRIHDEAVKLWEDANCYKCYDWNATLIIVTDTQQQNWTMDFEVFMNLTEKLEVCEKQDIKEICDNCAKNYTELNKFYEGIKKKYQKNICFDIENSMNRTRRYWSGNLGCCHDDKASFLVFSIVASIIGSLPILFYFSAYFISKRTEDLSPVTDGMTPNIPSINNHEPQPGTSNSSSASTAVIDDSPTFLINNNTSSNVFKNTNVKNIVKQSNIEVNPNNLLQRNSEAVLPVTPVPQQQSQNLIDLERSPAQTASLINSEGASNVPDISKFL